MEVPTAVRFALALEEVGAEIERAFMEKGELTMRTIDADELRTQFDDIPPFIGMTGGCVQQYIDKAPTIDAVPVVRCQDCKRRGTDDCPMYFEEDNTYTDDDGHREWDWTEHDHTRDDGFCDRGERKE